MDTQIQEITSEQLDALFEGVPPSTPNAENVAGTKEINGDENQPAVFQKPVDGIGAIEELPEGLLDEETPEAKVEREKLEAAAKEEEDKKPKGKAKPLTEEEKAAKVIADTEAAKVLEEQQVAVNEVLTNTVNFLIESGQWEEFEGREGLEMTQEVYAELVAKQNEYKVTELFNDLVDQTGDYGKAIISHIKRGGNPDEIIDLFKEQKIIESIDTSKEEGKQALIESYYKDILGWKSEKVNKTIKRLVEDNEIDSEFTDVKESYDKHFQEKLAESTKILADQEKVAKQREEQFKTNIKTTLAADESLSDKEKKILADSILNFKHPIAGGQKVNDFYVKFAEMQNDPKKYINLVRYVMNPEAFEKQIETKKESEAAKKTFNFIKGNALTKTTKSPALETADAQRNNNNTSGGTNFSFLLNKK